MGSYDQLPRFSEDAREILLKDAPGWTGKLGSLVGSRFSSSGHAPLASLILDAKAGWASGSDSEEQMLPDLEVGIQAQGPEVYSQALEAAGFTVDAEFVEDVPRGELETLATPPGRITVQLPTHFNPGEKVVVRGPHGRRMEVEAPSDGVPGEQLELRLAPTPELRIQVPLSARPGSQLQVRTASGARVRVVVPEGMLPGDFFEVAPPTLMVAVPEGAEPGDIVFFQQHKVDACGKKETQNCRAEVPQELLFGKYFAARLPECPGGAQPAPLMRLGSLSPGGWRRRVPANLPPMWVKPVE
jgi:hypothetical protein